MRFIRVVVRSCKAAIASSLAVLAVGICPIAAATGPVRISTDGNAPGRESGFVVAAGADGGAQLVAWGASEGRGVWGRILNRRGNLARAPFEISEQPGGESGHSAFPAVAARGRYGEFLVAWRESPAGSDGGSEIVARRIGARGRFLSDRIAIAGPAASAPDAPVITYNRGRDEFLVVWHARTATGRSQVHAARLQGGAATPSRPFRVSPGKRAGVTVSNYSAAAAYDSRRGRYLVVWESYDANAVSSEVHGRIVPSDPAKRLGATRSLSRGVSSGVVLAPDIAYSSHTREYALVWNVGDNTARIYGRRVRPDARPASRLRELAPAGSVFPSIEARPSGGYLLAFATRGLDGTLAGARVLRLGPGFDPRGQRSITAYGPDRVGPPRLAYSPPRDAFLAVWPEAREPADEDSSYDAFARWL